VSSGGHTAIVVGYDGSPAAAAAIEVAARLLPDAQATIAHFWSPALADSAVRDRLAGRAESLEDLTALVEREAAAEADRLATDGAALARAGGWDAQPLARRTYGDPGHDLARLSRERGADLLVLASRGLGGVRAMLGSTSDLAVHVSAIPVLVVPHPTLSGNGEAAASGPIVVGYDGSTGSCSALAAAASIFRGREIVVATVRSGDAEAADDAALERAGAQDADAVVLEAGAGGARSVASALVGAAVERAAAVVAVGSRGRSMAREVVLGSVAKSVLHDAQRPVLVVPERRLA
jgi:nucleotide-binding universal stress UspA family protein